MTLLSGVGILCSHNTLFLLSLQYYHLFAWVMHVDKLVTTNSNTLQYITYQT